MEVHALSYEQCEVRWPSGQSIRANQTADRSGE